MKKQVVDLVRNYIRRLSDDDFTFIYSRLHDRMGGDMGDAISQMQRSPDIDHWFSTAKTCNEMYDMIDLVYQYMDSEVSGYTERVA